MNGLSTRNLLAMKVFAREFPKAPIAQQPVAQLPWGHILQLMQKVNHLKLRRYVVIELKALQSRLPGEFIGKLPIAKQLADIVWAEMEGGK